MRKIKYIAIHCSATSQSATIDSIKRYWREKLKWRSPGYHYIIEADGNVTQLHDEQLASNGVRGYNDTSINVCYIGGVDASGRSVDNRTYAQKQSLENVVRILRATYPNAIVQGHRDFPKVAKDCPCFDAKKEYSNLI